ncbi:MAG: malto-oligosyltrehalose trehalohydrolase [Rubrivivax sp.]
MRPRTEARRERRVHDMPYGTRWRGPGVCEFRLWAPAAARVELWLGDATRLPMSAQAAGWFSLTVRGANPGLRYAYALDGGPALPDPASRSLPDGVLGPSELVDPTAHRWRDAGWRGRPWHEAVLYEVHVGAFSPQGDFDGLRARLPRLAAQGITALQLMPVAAFAGQRNWGYDGVQPFAPHPAYGGPQAFKRLVEAAHQHGLMVLLDVVYNHFGPVGNVLHTMAPAFFDPARQTPWGPALRLRGPGSRAVRDYFIHNALYWVEEFHLDGLRLDAVHAMQDRSRDDASATGSGVGPDARPSGGLVEEIARALQRGPGRQRHIHLVLENDANESDRLQTRRRRHTHAAGARAQWNDDFHHAVHVRVTGEQDGWYADYDATDARDVGRALARGFVYQGQSSGWRGGRPRGQSTRGLAPTAFIHFLQNHDQIGNRALGERLDALTGTRPLQALTVCLLLAPAIPLLFMGQDCGVRTPFLYFCDHDDAPGGLGEAVAAGRREEFRHFTAFADPEARAEIPDPNALDTFLRCVLDPSGLNAPEALAAWRRTQALLRLRRRWLVPRLQGARLGRWALGLTPARPAGFPEPVRAANAEPLTVCWPLARRTRWLLQANLQDAPAHGPIPSQARLIHATDTVGPQMPAWSVRVWLVRDHA